MTLLLRYWKFIAGAIVILFLVGGILSYGHRQYERGVADTKAELQSELEKAREHWEEIEREADSAKDERIAELERRATRVIRRDPPIRMCDTESSVRVPEGTNPGSAGGSVLPAGRDLQPELVQYGRDCEALRQELLTVKQKLEALHER
jgi:hypothetical protein